MLLQLLYACTVGTSIVFCISVSMSCIVCLHVNICVAACVIARKIFVKAGPRGGEFPTKFSNFR